MPRAFIKLIFTYPHRLIRAFLRSYGIDPFVRGFRQPHEDILTMGIL